MEYTVSSESELEEVAQTLVLELEQEKIEQATILGLSGELGAGKTTLTKAIARTLGVHEHVPSPTFVLARYYPIPKHATWSTLVHIDAYRIESLDELRPLRFASLFAEPKNLVVLEWPERLTGALPPHTRMLELVVEGETVRRIRDKYILQEKV